jgi:hypothetical protein
VVGTCEWWSCDLSWCLCIEQDQLVRYCAPQCWQEHSLFATLLPRLRSVVTAHLLQQSTCFFFFCCNPKPQRILVERVPSGTPRARHHTYSTAATHQTHEAIEVAAEIGLVV